MVKDQDDLAARVDHLEALLWSLVESRWPETVAAIEDLAFIDAVIGNLTPPSRRASVRRMFFGRMDSTGHVPKTRDQLLVILAGAIDAADSREPVR